MDSSVARLVETKKQISEKIAKLAERFKKSGDASLESFSSDPCEVEQAAYDALVTDAAMKYIAYQDKQAEADTKHGEWTDAEMLAMAGHIVLQECRNENPPT